MCIMAAVSPIGRDGTSTRYKASDPKDKERCQLPGIRIEPTENIDTTTSGGKLVFHIFGALAEFERDIITDRTKAGLHAARVRGRLGGRPKAKMLDNPKKVALAQSLYENEDNTIDEICRTLNVSRATLYRYIKAK
jgi:DNA invertase Pin-like site-specific DNA recombinase